MNTMPPSPSSENRNTLLRYQKNRTLDRCGGYAASFQLETRSGDRFFIGLRADGLEIFTGKDRRFLYDGEGRPLAFSSPNEYCFRGVSHQGTFLRRQSGFPSKAYERELLPTDRLNDLCREGWQTGCEARAALGQECRILHPHPNHEEALTRIRPSLDKIHLQTPEALREEAVRYREVYQPVPVLPPDHYGSLVLQATEGCSFNTCAFCALYRGVTFRIRTVSEFEQHVTKALSFHGEGLRRFTGLFLGQANALSMPQNRLLSILECIRRHVELPEPEHPQPPAWAHGHRLRFTGIGSFLDGFTGLRKSPGDYAALRQLGLSRVCLGVESGCNSLLRWLRKPATTEEMGETIRRLKEGGLFTDIVVLTGVGGKPFAEDHERGTIEFVRNSRLTRGDRVYLSPIKEYPETDYARLLDDGQIQRLTPVEIREQTERMARAIRACGPQAVPYRIEPFVY